MSQIVLEALDRPGIAPLPISARLKSQLVYFTSQNGAPGVPQLQENEFFFAAADVANWLEDGVLYLVSPLDTAKKTEIELSEEQEELMTWLQAQGVQHVRVRA